MIRKNFQANGHADKFRSLKPGGPTKLREFGIFELCPLSSTSLFRKEYFPTKVSLKVDFNE